MNPETGELRRMLSHLNGLPDPDGFEPVIRDLEMAARLKLGDEMSARVNLRSNHPLARWAATVRKEKKRKAKLAAASRRRNRK